MFPKPLTSLNCVDRRVQQFHEHFSKQYADQNNDKGPGKEIRGIEINLSPVSYTHLAVLLSNGAGGSKRMYVGAGFKGKVFRDFLGKCEDKVMIQEDGTGVFFTADRSVSVWYASGEE